MKPQVKALFIVELDTGLLIEHVTKVSGQLEVYELLNKFIEKGITISGPGEGNSTRYSPNVIRSISTQRLQ